jgi:hypothetical protein
LDDDDGPTDGECYLMAADANYCMAVAASGAMGDVARAMEMALAVVEIRLDKDEAEYRALPVLIREIFGYPFRPVAANPAWLTPTVLQLARGIYESRDFSTMPILADALQDAGCDNADVLKHCRDAKATHVRGCWVVDLVLGKD